MPSTYVIRDWLKLFENNRTRELKRLDWVPVPNKMDGVGYSELVDHPNGAAHLGAWLAILEIASRQTQRGTIPQESAGLCGDILSTCRCLSRISHLPVEVFSEALPRLIQIGWLEMAENGVQVQQNLRSGTIPQDDAGKCLSRAREQNRIEENTTPPTPANAAVEKTAREIHARHPARRRNVSVAMVEKKLRAILKYKHVGNANVPAFLNRLNETHAGMCASADWQKDGGEFAKALGNWLAPTAELYDVEPAPLFRSGPNPKMIL